MKKKHPSNRYERLKIKEIKNDNPSKDRAGHVRRKLLREAEEVQELEHELSEVKVRPRAEEEGAQPVVGYDDIRR